jgi:hypothetical protein
LKPARPRVKGRELWQLKTKKNTVQLQVKSIVLHQAAGVEAVSMVVLKKRDIIEIDVI